MTEERVAEALAEAEEIAARLTDMSTTGEDFLAGDPESGDILIERYLDETLELAQALGINGTPAFLIGDQIVPGAIGEAEFRALIEGSRKPKG